MVGERKHPLLLGERPGHSWRTKVRPVHFLVRRTDPPPLSQTCPTFGLSVGFSLHPDDQTTSGVFPEELFWFIIVSDNNTAAVGETKATSVVQRRALPAGRLGPTSILHFPMFPAFVGLTHEQERLERLSFPPEVVRTIQAARAPSTTASYSEMVRFLLECDQEHRSHIVPSTSCVNLPSAVS